MKNNYYDSETKSGRTKFNSLLGQWRGLFYILIIGLLFWFFITNLNDIGKFLGDTVSHLKPVIIGIVLAYILNPLMKKVNRRLLKLYQKIWPKKEITTKVKSATKGISIGVSLTLALFCLYLLLSMVIPQVLSTLSALINSLPKRVNTYYDLIYDKLNNNKFFESQLQNLSLEFTSNLDDIINQKLLPYLQKEILPNVNNYAQMLANGVFSLFGFFLNLIIGVIVAVYILLSTEKFSALAKKVTYSMFSRKQATIIIHYARVANESFSGFFIGKIIDSFILGIITFIFNSIFKIPYAMLVSVIVGVCNMIPIFGQYIGGIPSILLILMIDPIKCITFTVYFIIMKQIDGNLIGPAIVGNSTGLSAFWVLFSILVFGGWFGLVGMIVGVPIFALLYRIVKDYVEYRLIKRRLKRSTDDYLNLKLIEIDENGKNEYIHFNEQELTNRKMRQEQEKEITISTIMFGDKVGELRKSGDDENTTSTSVEVYEEHENSKSRSKFQRKVGNKIEDIKEDVSETIDDIGDKIDDIREDISDKIDDIKEDIGDKLEDIGDKLKDKKENNED
ncbi:MAG: AI-2E family transporter [Lachnospiraceae bacterium]|nr:AI-2E family transporter [Lachnospiraceae bacterium]